MAGQVSQAVAKADERRTPAHTMREAIKASEPGFAMALPSHVKPDRFLRAALTALNTVPKLAECTQTSVLAGLMQAAQLGLEVADVRGQAYLIPRKTKGVMQATFQLGFRGMIDLAARSGITVDVDEICANDSYDFQRGTKPYLHHKPTLGDRGDTIAYYAVASFSDGRPPQFTIMGKAEVEKHRDQFGSSRDYNTKEISGPWLEHFDAMARKTVVRQLLNYLPVSVELREANAIDVQEAAPQYAGNVNYGAPVAGALPPENVDPQTGEIDAAGAAVDPMDAIDVTEAGDTLLLDQ